MKYNTGCVAIAKEQQTEQNDRTEVGAWRGGLAQHSSNNKADRGERCSNFQVPATNFQFPLGDGEEKYPSKEKTEVIKERLPLRPFIC